jgi:hypothetical protein
MIQNEFEPRSVGPPVWQPVLFAAFAGGLAWGIRGQYGHETGAMLAGLLIGLVLCLLFCPEANSLAVARAVSWCTVAMGFGGSMTYGQTIGLTSDPALVGHWNALLWGMVGLALKGGVWIGFAGAFLGMGLGGVRYRPLEVLLVMLGMIGLYSLGLWVLNEPFDPTNKVLPRVYFSADWFWTPGAALKPRRENWGGLLFSLIGLMAYTSRWRRDPLSLRLGLWGVLGGVVGFPLGQCLQAFHAWNTEFFHTEIWTRIDPIINWWNFMETTFGTVMGALLGLGLWIHRRRIAVSDIEPESLIPPIAESLLFAVHVALLVGAELLSISSIEWFAENSLVLGLIPIVAITSGRCWPYLLMLPITAIPIAGKTLRQLAYREHSIGVIPGWLLYIVLPLAIATAMAFYFARPSARSREARPFLRTALLFTAWLYFLLNFGFFNFPWVWSTWTSRTPNAIVFTAYTLGLTVLVFMSAAGSSTPATWRGRVGNEQTWTV